MSTPLGGNAEPRQRRLDDGWAVWEGGRDYIQGMWPGEKIGRTEHAHAHNDGPFFNHGHPGGAAPHDHAPGDRQLPKWAREKSLWIGKSRSAARTRSGKPSRSGRCATPVRQSVLLPDAKWARGTIASSTTSRLTSTPGAPSAGTGSSGVWLRRRDED